MSFNQVAYQNRAVRNIQNELDFLLETGVLTSGQTAQILNILPSPSGVTSMLHAQTPGSMAPAQSATPAVPHMGFTPPMSPPASTKTPAHEKAMQPISGPTPPQPPPPSYAASAPPILSRAEALWAFKGSEVGDLCFEGGDIIEVVEKIKDDWWRGHVMGSMENGLFPSSYVKETQILSTGNGKLPGLPPRKETGYSGYGPGGNMMTDVAHGSSSNEYQDTEKKGALGKNGEKFGKKLGNAAIFGAGATIGGKIVNGIF